MTTVTCCEWEFVSGDEETVLRAFAKHLEDDHGTPREATIHWLQADVHARDAGGETDD